MNKYINFKLPEFFEKYGQDWTSFMTIIDEAIDHYLSKVFGLSYFSNINTMSEKVVELSLDALNIPIDSDDIFKTKKLKLRNFVKQYKEKGLENFYLDIQEEIFGIRGVIYSGLSLGTIRWGLSRWHSGTIAGSDIRWANAGAQFEIYIDCQTDEILSNNTGGYFRWSQSKWDIQRWQDTAAIDDLLDRLVDFYRQKSVYPAFYKIYLIDSSFNILRTV